MAKIQENPEWVQEILDGYDSGASSQFVLYGNTSDNFLCPLDPSNLEGEACLTKYLQEILGKERTRITVNLDPAYENIEVTGNRPDLTQELFEITKSRPGRSLDSLNAFLLLLSNLPGSEPNPVTIFINNAEYLLGEEEPDKGALMLKAWSNDPHFLKENPLIILVTQSLGPLHSIITKNSRVTKIEVPYPDQTQIRKLFSRREVFYPSAFEKLKTEQEKDAAALAMAGTPLHALDSLIKKKDFQKEPLQLCDLAKSKRRIVETESRGMIEFLNPKGLKLDDLCGKANSAIAEQFKSDIILWNQGKINSIPNGILIIGPPGTGKTYILRCLAGSTDIPIAQINNFRGQYSGDAESNLELIFRLLKTLPQVYVFIDEAEQELGGRSQGGHDGGLSGRIYKAFATQMSDITNKGRMCWVLATSHPHLLEPDLKRPGRIDIKIPILPCENKVAGKILLAEIARKEKLNFEEALINENLIPDLLTPGGATTIAQEVNRRKLKNTAEASDLDTLHTVLKNYQPPNHQKMVALTAAAITESSSKEFIPQGFLDNPIYNPDI